MRRTKFYCNQYKKMKFAEQQKRTKTNKEIIRNHLLAGHLLSFEHL